MTQKDEKEVLGDAVQKAIKSAAREAAGEKLTGNAKALNDLLDEVVAQNQALTVKIWRKGFGINANTEEFIKPLLNVNPEMLRDSGIEPLIQQYCGGGTYRVLLSAQGVPSKQMTMVIAGEPLIPKPERDLQSIAAGGGQLPFGMPMPVPGGGFNMGTPGAAQYFGLSGAYGQQQSHQSHVSDAVMLAQLFASMMQKPQAAETDELKAMRAQVEELKAQNAAAAAEKARIESERRADAQIAELKNQMEKLAAPKEGTMEKVLSILGTATPTILGYLQSRENAQAAQIAAQQQAAQNQMNMIVTLFGTQGSASKENLELLKTMMLQPKESETDRMRGIMDIAMNSMSTTMGLTQAMVNQMQAMQPGERPPWMEVLMTIIENASAMGQAALEARAQKVGGAPEGEQPKKIEGAENVRALHAGKPEDEQPGILDAASAAAAAAQENLSAPDESGMMSSDEARMAGMEATGEDEDEVELPDFSAGAFKLIFEKITERDDDGIFTGSVYEVAFRIWKHASSGDREALLWVNNPEEYTLDVLDALAQQGYILVTAERIHEIADAMVDLYQHFKNGRSAQEYIQMHGLTLTLPKRMVVVPLEKGEAEVEEDEQPTDEGRAAQLPEQPTAPKEPAVPTPSFGGSPPPVRPV